MGDPCCGRASSRARSARQAGTVGVVLSETVPSHVCGEQARQLRWQGGPDAAKQGVELSVIVTHRLPSGQQAPEPPGNGRSCGPPSAARCGHAWCFQIPLDSIRDLHVPRSQRTAWLCRNKGAVPSERGVSKQRRLSEARSSERSHLIPLTCLRQVNFGVRIARADTPGGATLRCDQ
jgi:hypothetical protein